LCSNVTTVLISLSAVAKSLIGIFLIAIILLS
jgi:hypothetical protein